tara:strand:+ start:394 stop:573 length:180 start_codon:yes stop_codon:yes gene_type:complete
LAIKVLSVFTVPHSHSLAHSIFNTQSIPIHPRVLALAGTICTRAAAATAAAMAIIKQIY